MSLLSETVACLVAASPAAAPDISECVRCLKGCSECGCAVDRDGSAGDAGCVVGLRYREVKLWEGLPRRLVDATQGWLS